MKRSYRVVEGEFFLQHSWHVFAVPQAWDVLPLKFALLTEAGVAKYWTEAGMGALVKEFGQSVSHRLGYGYGNGPEAYGQVTVQDSLLQEAGCVWLFGLILAIICPVVSCSAGKFLHLWRCTDRVQSTSDQHQKTAVISSKIIVEPN